MCSPWFCRADAKRLVRKVQLMLILRRQTPKPSGFSLRRLTRANESRTHRSLPVQPAADFEDRDAHRDVFTPANRIAITLYPVKRILGANMPDYGVTDG